MDERSGFQGALHTFLASGEFEDVVQDDRAQLPVVPRVVELHRDGTFTVYSRREDATSSPDTVILEIPPRGTAEEVRARLHRELGG
jgi:hypothetical protein